MAKLALVYPSQPSDAYRRHQTRPFELLSLFSGGEFFSPKRGAPKSPSTN